MSGQRAQIINSATKGNGPKPNHVLCHSTACIHSDGDRVGDSEPEAEGDGVADADSEAEQEHGGEMHACIRRSWGGSCHLEMPKLWVWHHQAGEAYQRQTQTQMGLGLWHKAIVWEAATPSHLGGNGYSSKLINTKRQCDRMISHAVFPICLSLGLRPWGLGLGRWRGERARACGVYRQQLTSPARFSTKCASLTPGMDIGVNGHGGINWQGSI
jgi:hypothetical protein